MATPLAVFSLLVALAATPAPMPERLEFSGYLQARGATQFLLTDTQGKTTSGWIGLGAAFGGYTLLGFDTKSETLTVEKAGAVVHLRLKAARTVAARATALEPQVTQAEIDAGLARPMPIYAYNQQRGAYEVTGFTWRRLDSTERQVRENAPTATRNSQASGQATTEKAQGERASGETVPAVPASAEKL